MSNNNDNVTTSTTTSPSNKECRSVIPWWLSFAVSAAVYGLGVVIIGLIYLIRFIQRKRPAPVQVEIIRRKSRIYIKGGGGGGGGGDSDDDIIEEEDVSSLRGESEFLKLQLWCEKMTSRSTKIGRVTCLFQVSLNLLSWAIYLAFTHYQASDHYLEGDCYEPPMVALKWIDLGLNIFFAVHLILRAFASLDILKFWVLATTLVDICVIPNILITSLTDVRRQGMSFLRAIYLRYFVDYIFVTFGIMKINSKTQIFILIVYLLSVWMIGSGFIHLLENVGDFWTKPTNKQEWTFWECCYFMLVTVSTVGFGDYSPKTLLGRLLICVYIIYAYALFGSSIPQIVYTFNNHKYHEKYVTRSGEKHIIVTGQFDNTSLKNFFAPFVCNSQTFNRNLKLILMNPEMCDRNLSIYIKKLSSCIKYMVGSPRNNADADRANIKKAKAAVVLASPNSQSDNDNDSENIMTAISIKSYKERIRIIIQLHTYCNKILLKMFPKWNRHGTDTIICMDEIRLGLMAYNCLVPGIATLITNLLCSNKPKRSSVDWRKNYEDGLCNRLYNVEFSDDFNGMSCLEVSMIIYKLFDVCLVAVVTVDEEDTSNRYVTINPACENVTVKCESMIAIVIARDESSASKISFYCQRCSSQMKSVKICKCLINSYKSMMPYTKIEAPITEITFSDNTTLKLDTVKVNYGSNPGNQIKGNGTAADVADLQDKRPSLDYASYKLESDSDEVNIDKTGTFHWTKAPAFQEICVDVEFAESLRFSNHILLCLCGSGEGNVDLSSFLMPLRFRSLVDDNLKPIVILGSKSYFDDSLWINIRNFPKLFIIDGSPLRARDLRAAGIFNCHACSIINVSHGSNQRPTVSSKQALFCSTLIRAIRKAEIKRGRDIKFTMITELEEDEVASFLSTTDCHEDYSKLPVDHTEAFARGLLFTNSVLYRCIHSIYYNPEIFNFLACMISGPNFNMVEKTLGTGCGLLPWNTSQHACNSNTGMVFKLLSISEPLFTNAPGLNDGTLTYGELYKWALEKKQILCIGLSRKYIGRSPYVFTNPRAGTEVSMTDKVYCCLSNQIIQSKF